MDYSMTNTNLWNMMLHMGWIGGTTLFAFFLRNRLSVIRKLMIPVPVLAGFILLIFKLAGIFTADPVIMEALVFHCIALGFIALGLKVLPEKKEGQSSLTGVKTAIIIVSTFMVQGIAGSLITIILSKTVMPDLFPLAGMLLPMGFGQGPGQANNFGATYETMGFTGGRSFGLSLAAAGYLVACIAGVIILNILVRSGKLDRIQQDGHGEQDINSYSDKDEILSTDPMDKLTLQAGLVLVVYMLTFGLAGGITLLLQKADGPMIKNLITMLWGFNFILGMAIAMILKKLLTAARNKGIIRFQVQNNYLLSRISNFMFDVMVVAGIVSIDFTDISGLLIPFLVLVAVGTVLTWIYLAFACKRVYEDYYYEALLSLYGCLTGTVGSAVLLLREVDPQIRTPAIGNLAAGSGIAVVFSIPMLVMAAIPPDSNRNIILFCILNIVYMLILQPFIFMKRKNRQR